jgi:hypothetical protein
MAAYWADSADKWRRSAEHHLDAIRCHLGCHVTRSQVLRLARTRSRFVQRVTVRRLKASTPYSKHLHRPVEREVPVISPVPRSRALVVVKRGGSR